MKEEYDLVLKKVKRKKRVFLTIVIFTALFAALFHKGNIIMNVEYGFVPGWAFAIIFAVAFVSAFIVGISNSILIKKILRYECDPVKYLYVYENNLSARQRANPPVDLTVVRSIAFFDSGDFTNAREEAKKLLGTKKEFLGYYVLLKTAYLENRTEEFLELYPLFAGSVETSPEKNALGNPISLAAFLNDAVTGEKQDVIKRAESFSLPASDPYNTTVAAFFRGKVFLSCGEIDSAKECFETAARTGGKLWFREESERLLEEIGKDGSTKK